MPSATTLSPSYPFPSHPCHPLKPLAFGLTSVSPTRVEGPGSQARGARIRPVHIRFRRSKREVGHPTLAGPRRRSAGHRGGALGRASAEGSGSPSPPQPLPSAGAAASGQLRPERGGAASTPPAPSSAPAGWRPRRGGERLWTPGAFGRRPPSATRHPLRPQHVARSCARRHGPRAAPGPPPPVRRRPGGAGPQPAARSLLQPGEPAGGKALGLFGPQFT